MAIFVKNNQQQQRKLGCFGKTIIGVGVYLLFCGIIGMIMGSETTTKLEDNTIYRIDLKGELIDHGTEENPFASFLPAQAMPSTVGLDDLLSNIALAKNNDKVLGIYLKG
jgi:hypothetical protein